MLQCFLQADFYLLNVSALSDTSIMGARCMQKTEGADRGASCCNAPQSRCEGAVDTLMSEHACSAHTWCWHTDSVLSGEKANVCWVNIEPARSPGKQAAPADTRWHLWARLPVLSCSSSVRITVPHRHSSAAVQPCRASLPGINPPATWFLAERVLLQPERR